MLLDMNKGQVSYSSPVSPSNQPCAIFVHEEYMYRLSIIRYVVVSLYVKVNKAKLLLFPEY